MTAALLDTPCQCSSKWEQQQQHLLLVVATKDGEPSQLCWLLLSLTLSVCSRTNGVIHTKLHLQTLTASLMGCSAANQDLLTAVLSSEVPATPLGSFPAIFNQALALGMLSRRRVYHEAQLQQQKKKGRKWQAGLQKKEIAVDVPHRSAANTVEAADFHWHLASNDRVR